MPRQPEEQNQLVNFENIPDSLSPPDVGISILVEPRSAQPEEPIMLSAVYNADGALLEKCQPELASCIKLHVVEIFPTEKLPEGDVVTPPNQQDEFGKLATPFQKTLPLMEVLDDIVPPPAGEYGPHYREGGQFQLDLKVFFELPERPAHYSVTVHLGSYLAGPEPFEILAP